MKQSSLRKDELNGRSCLHVAIIMDGNGRWASLRGLPRANGHAAGAKALQPMIEVCPSLGIRNLTVYAFSADNWQRPADERLSLFALFESFLRREVQRCVEHGVEIRCIGWRHRLPASLQEAIEDAERCTAGGSQLTLRIAMDYSSRAALAHAAALATPAECWPPAPMSRQSMDYALAVVYGQPGRKLPAVDLLIRTGGQQRLSDFLLWESAYAELWFTDTLWPDFQPMALEAAIAAFHQRQRTYGGLPSLQVQVPLQVVGGLQ